jgi:Domain of unknown function (DUF4276)
MKIGIIAEDDSDVAVLREITLTLLRPRVAGFKRFVGGGSGKVRRKCGAWASNLVKQGCPWIVVIHDLDEHNEVNLRAELTASIAPSRAPFSIVLIPKREIEAWLLYDRQAIAKAFKEHRLPKLPGNPESLADPKKHLRDLVRKSYRKEYLNTVHNAQIAKHISAQSLRTSPSFFPHFAFSANIRAALA